jgi:hypothetical protein
MRGEGQVGRLSDRNGRSRRGAREPGQRRAFDEESGSAKREEGDTGRKGQQAAKRAMQACQPTALPGTDANTTADESVGSPWFRRQGRGARPSSCQTASLWLRLLPPVAGGPRPGSSCPARGRSAGNPSKLHLGLPDAPRGRQTPASPRCSLLARSAHGTQPADRRLAMLPALSYLGRAPAACRRTRPFPSGMCATPAAICTRPCRVGTGRTDGSAATPAGACISARRLPRRASAAVCCTMHISHRSCDIAAGENSGYCPSLPPRRQAVDPVRHGRVTPAESHAMDRGGPCAADLTSASRASTLPGATVCPWRLNLCPRQLPTPSPERIPYHRHSPTDLLQD